MRTRSWRSSRRPGRRWPIAVGVYAVFCFQTAYSATGHGHPEAWLGMLAVPLAILGRGRPLLLGAALVLGGAWLRIVVGTFGELADQVAVSQAAGARAFAGENPYGVLYPEGHPDDASFPYGPLMLIWGWTGIWGEAVASIGTLVLIALTRSWLTLAAFAGSGLFVVLATVGINDSAPAFFVTAALLAIRARPLVGGVLLGVAAALKPYALAWFPSVIAYAGVSAGLGAVVTSAILWSPVLVWGPGSFMRSVDLARAVHTEPANALNMPALRIIALPIAIAALFARRWTVAVLAGSAVFMIVLFLDTWASPGYLLTVVPITGIAIEQSVARWFRRRQAARATDRGQATSRAAQVP